MYLGNANTYSFKTVSLYRGVGTGVYVTPVLWLTFFFFFFLNKLHCPREMFLQIQFPGKYSFRDTWLAGPPTKRFGELCPPREAWGLHVTTSLSVASALTGVHQPPVSTSTFRLRQVPGTLRAANLPNIVKNARLSQVSESNTATSWLKTNNSGAQQSLETWLQRCLGGEFNPLRHVWALIPPRESPGFQRPPNPTTASTRCHKDSTLRTRKEHLTWKTAVWQRKGTFVKKAALPPGPVCLWAVNNWGWQLETAVWMQEVCHGVPKSMPLDFITDPCSSRINFIMDEIQAGLISRLAG